MHAMRCKDTHANAQIDVLLPCRSTGLPARKINTGVAAMAALRAEIVAALEMSVEPEQLRLEYLDADFEEYVDLKSCDELPAKCKVRSSLFKV